MKFYVNHADQSFDDSYMVEIAPLDSAEIPKLDDVEIEDIVGVFYEAYSLKSKDWVFPSHFTVWREDGSEVGTYDVNMVPFFQFRGEAPR